MNKIGVARIAFVFFKQPLANFKKWLYIKTRRLVNRFKKRWPDILISAVISFLVSFCFYTRASSRSKQLLETTSKTMIDKMSSAVNTATNDSTTSIKNAVMESTTSSMEEIKTTLGNTVKKASKEIAHQMQLSTELSTAEITKALNPSDFAFVFEETEFPMKKEQDQILIKKTKSKEIKFYFSIRNKSKYPAKDVIYYLLIDKETITDAKKVLSDYFQNTISRNLTLECAPTDMGENTILKGAFERKGWVDIIPILPGAYRNWPAPLTFKMTGDRVNVVAEVNGYIFALQYQLTK